MSTTYEQERTEQQKEIDAEVMERVKRGLEWLEQEHGPGWEDKINMETLDLRFGDQCVLGQVFSTPEKNGYSLFYDKHILDEETWIGDHGFCSAGNGGYPALQKAWVHVLTPRVRQT